MANGKALDVPPAAQRDKAAFELLRVWVANQNQHVSLRYDAWEDPFAWGLVLADLARHVANAHSQNDPKVDAVAYLERIVEGFEAEIESPTDEAEGEISGV